jgi:hypothetical protein
MGGEGRVSEMEICQGLASRNREEEAAEEEDETYLARVNSSL